MPAERDAVRATNDDNVVGVANVRVFCATARHITEAQKQGAGVLCREGGVGRGG